MHDAYNSFFYSAWEDNMLGIEGANFFANSNYKGFHNLKSTRVLLIDDDRTTRRMVFKALGDYCDWAEACTAGLGVAKFQNFDPDIVFLDLELPDNNGHNILNWIMRNDPGAYVVLFSVSCDRQNVKKALDNGVRGFVPKPFNADLMMHHICKCPKLH